MDIFERSKLRIDAPRVFFVDDCLGEVLEALDHVILSEMDVLNSNQLIHGSKVVNLEE
jgi:hypothetical protein